MPADFGGDIYASFADRADLSGVQGVIAKFLAGL